MSDTDKELSHLEKLEARMAKLRMQIAKEKKKESAKVRKERTHRLIKKGGLVEMVWGDSVDAGLLVGLLDSRKELIQNPESGQARELKARGDKLIAERERGKEAHKKDGGARAESAGNPATTSTAGQNAENAADSYARIH
ncbi:MULTISPECIES: conjugal transfer protein TraD [Selenomonas]|jgi:hypothetical protein|uniref:Conjugal transfer protein TraD n=1 Tax=Selenomonas ruminis TaxID=2593411 RepID=A0A5D6VYS8_9FIRM|nr:MULTISPECIES: conjugal transfer protein TraD [Selenomonas]MBQ1856339.1 conjugal transfer protein TraD [Anaerovibrio sp.]TYZ20069.1 conjugal transfer protein TraD [Selenomonas sp. mPRGC5]